MPSILSGNRVVATVQDDAAGNPREITESKGGSLTTVKSTDTPATITMHAADKQQFDKCGLTS